MKKFIALFLTFALVIGFASFTPVANAASEEELLNDVGTYPIVKEPIELRIFAVTQPHVEDFATNDFTKFLEEKTGIKLIWETGTRDNWEEKLNLAFGTDDYPDIIMFASPNQAKYGVKEGILIQLDDLIEKNMPNYTREMGAYIGNTRQTDGHIYAIAGLNECYHCRYAKKLWANMDWIEKIGLGIPKTTEEFYEVCKKFLELNPKGIAVAGAAKGWNTRVEEWLTNPFILAPASTQGFRLEVGLTPEGKVDTIANKEEYRDALRYMKSLYDLGAFYPANFSQTAEQLQAVANQEGEPILFVASGTISNVFDAVSAQEVYKKYRVIAPIAGPAGVARSTFMKYSGISDVDFFITDKCQYPQAALRWIDYFFTTEGALSSQYGAEEGKDWILNPEGQVGLNGEPALYKVLSTYSNEAQNHDWQDLQVKYFPASFRLSEATDANIDVAAPEGLEKLLFEETKNQMEPFAQKEGDWDVLPYLKLTDEETSEIQTIAVEIENHITQNMAAFVTGNKDIEAGWDEYVKAFDNLQLEKLLSIYQTAYDRTK